MTGAIQVGGVLRKRPELRSGDEVAAVHRVLQALPFYQRLHPDPAACGPAQVLLCRSALLKEVDQDEVLHEEGSVGLGFCLVLSGAFAEYKRQYATQSGAGRYLHKLGPGRGFGEEALTQATPRAHSSTLVGAEAGTEVLVLRRDDYVAMVATTEQALKVSPALRSESDVLSLFALASTLLFFRPVSPPSLLHLARAFMSAVVTAGDVIARQGQVGSALYVILDGGVVGQLKGQTEGADVDGDSHSDSGAQLQAGDAFGEDALLHGDGLHSRTFVATGASRLLIIPRAAFDRTLRGLGPRLHFQPGQTRRTLAQMPRSRSTSAVEGLARQMHGLPFFSPFSFDSVRHVASSCTLTHAYKGDRVFDQGSVSSAFYVLLSGAVSIFVREQTSAEAGRTASASQLPSGPLSEPPALFNSAGESTRRGTRTIFGVGGGEADLPDVANLSPGFSTANSPPSVPLTMQLLSGTERGSRRGDRRYVSNTDASVPSPEPLSPSRRSRFATASTGMMLTPALAPLEPLLPGIGTHRVSLHSEASSPRGRPTRHLLDPLERPDASGGPPSPRHTVLPPPLDDLPEISRDKPRRRTGVAAPFVPPPWPGEASTARTTPGAAGSSGSASPAGQQLSPKLRLSQSPPSTTPSRPTSAKGSPRGGGRGLSDEEFDKLVSSFRGGANRIVSEAGKGTLITDALPAPRKSNSSSTSNNNGSVEHGDPSRVPAGCSRPWKGFLLSGGDADVDAMGRMAKKRWGRLVRTCGEGDAFGEMELLEGEPQLRAATVVVTETSELLVVPLDAYRRHIQVFHSRQLSAHCAFLSAVPLFRSLSPPALQSLVYRVRPREVTAKGAMIVEQGRAVDGMYLVHSGECVISAAPPNQSSAASSSPSASPARSVGGVRVDYSVVGPGAVFGESSLSGVPSDYTVTTASARVTLLVLHPTDVRELGAGVAGAVAALGGAKAAFRAAHAGLALAGAQRSGGEVVEGRQLPAWLQSTMPVAQAEKVAPPRQLAPLEKQLVPTTPNSPRPRVRLELQIPLPATDSPSLGGTPMGSPRQAAAAASPLSARGSDAGSPFVNGVLAPLRVGLSWPASSSSSPPGSPTTRAMMMADTGLEAHMAQVMGASWGLRTPA